MKRLLLILVVLAGLGAWWIINWEPNAPRFRAVRPRSSTAQPTFLYSSPFNQHLTDSAIWLTVGTSSNQARYLQFDVQQRLVTGELIGAAPLFSDRAGRRIMCMQRNTRALPLWNKLKVLVNKATFGAIRFVRPFASANETFWVIDLEHNKVTRLGERIMLGNYSSAWSASPSGRYAFSVAFATNQMVYLCDLSNLRWWTMRLPAASSPVGGVPLGWWDDTNLLIQAANGFDLFDIEKSQQRTLLPRGAIDAFFREHGITGVPRRELPALGAYWDGREFEFYLFEHRASQGEPSYFVRIRRPDATLKLVSKDFEFEESGQFNPNAALYVFATRIVGDCCDGVSIRDVVSSRERRLLGGTKSGSYGRPFFFGNSICYVQTNALWQMDLNGSNRVRLFPP